MKLKLLVKMRCNTLKLNRNEDQLEIIVRSFDSPQRDL